MLYPGSIPRVEKHCFIELKTLFDEICAMRSSYSVILLQHPMLRFGSWVFQGTQTPNQAKQLCIDGGIIASLTWGLLQLCPKVVDSVHFMKYHFHLGVQGALFCIFRRKFGSRTSHDVASLCN